MNMSRTGWILTILVGVVLYLAARGRLADTVAAAQGAADPSNSGTSASGSTSGLPDTSTPSPSGFGNYHLFLDSKPASVLSGWPIAGKADAQGLPGAVFDWDYSVPVGTPVHLPGGPSQTYTVRNSWEPGRTAVFADPQTGGTFEYLHLTTDAVTGLTGQTLHGGDIVGTSGYPQGNLELGVHDPSNAHLAVVGDATEQRYFLSLGA